MWRHPKYYKELRKRNELAQRSAVKEDLACSGSSRISNKSDQAISDEASTEATSVRPGPDQSGKQQATSYKLPGPRPISNANKGLIHKRQATSKGKLQATSSKRQASE